MRLLRCGIVPELPHLDVVFADRFPGDDVDVRRPAQVAAAADLPHVLGLVKVRLVLHISHLLCVVSSPCFFVGPDSEELLSCSNKDQIRCAMVFKSNLD